MLDPSNSGCTVKVFLAKVSLSLSPMGNIRCKKERNAKLSTVFRGYSLLFFYARNGSSPFLYSMGHWLRKWRSAHTHPSTHYTACSASAAPNNTHSKWFIDYYTIPLLRNPTSQSLHLILIVDNPTILNLKLQLFRNIDPLYVVTTTIRYTVSCGW